MQDLYSIIEKLTSLAEIDRTRLLADFAYEFGWTPSDTLDIGTVGDFANAHLVVEHGLENTAVITFLRRRFAELGYEERKRLLNISYNNLVDWHIQVEPEQITFVFNRADPDKMVVEKQVISRGDIEGLRSHRFLQIASDEKRPNTKFPPLDIALNETISFWKRELSKELAEFDYKVSNQELSALFNAIIFVRAVEDHFRHIHNEAARDALGAHVLLKDWTESSNSEPKTLRGTIRRCLVNFDQEDALNSLIDESMLQAFDRLNNQNVYALLADFYRNKYTRAFPYEYDFSVMSKHALSRIYEHYVSVLRNQEPKEEGLFPFPLMPDEEAQSKAYGSVYTPQFIAKFFARYLRAQTTPNSFKKMRSIDPACGSGMFLRTLLEIQCDPTQDRMTSEAIGSIFQNTYGVDVDDNACQAARLSLSLLHLVLTDRLPSALNIQSQEAIDYYQKSVESHNTFDAILANPPMVRLEGQEATMQQRVSEFMDDDAGGRVDMYLPFLKLSLGLLKPGGYGLFVLPHSFLLNDSARGMRRALSNAAWVRCIADLSSYPVFGDKGVYAVLIIFQKRSENAVAAPNAQIARCLDRVGRALEEIVEGNEVENEFYNIYEVAQETFSLDNWVILPPVESAIRQKLSKLKTLDEFFHVHQGLITGADDVFIIPTVEVPKGEENIFVPFLPDKEMKPYVAPGATRWSVFYPFVEDRKIEEHEMQRQFPFTWRYLLSHKEKLDSRLPVRKGQLAWWQPVRPRVPKRLMRPKIITPHLVLLPRFSSDVGGEFAVSHSPVLLPKEKNGGDEILRFFTAILNSSVCFWYISQNSHKYRGGYTMLELKTLSKTPVPDPADVPLHIMRQILALVDARMSSSGVSAMESEAALDEIIAELYGLNIEERRSIGLVI